MLRCARTLHSILIAATIAALGACSGNAAPVPPSALSVPVSPFRPIIAPTSLFPNASLTGPTGIRGPLISATISFPSGATEGALYDRARGTWTRIVVPGTASTAAYGPNPTPQGYRVVGSFKPSGSKRDRAFVYDSTTKAFTTITMPTALCRPRACNEAIAHSTYGSGPYVVVGNADAVGSPAQHVDGVPLSGHAFMYNSTSGIVQSIDVRHALSTTAYGVWIDAGHVIVAGGYTNHSGSHGYVRDLRTGRLFTYDYPGAVVTHFEGLSGAGGEGNYTLAGDFVNAGSPQFYGFFLPIRNWTAGKPFVLGALSANSVYEHTVVGIMPTPSGVSGYLTVVP